MNLRIISALLLITFFLAGCSHFTTTPIPDLAVFQITKVIDKITGQPISANKIWIEIERENGDKLEFSDENIQGHRIEVQVGTSVYIKVEAPGYVDWELVVRFKEPKYMEGPVEMQPAGRIG